MVWFGRNPYVLFDSLALQQGRLPPSNALGNLVGYGGVAQW